MFTTSEETNFLETQHMFSRDFSIEQKEFPELNKRTCNQTNAINYPMYNQSQ